MIDRFGLVLLTMFGIGHIKYAPGTVASLICCIFFYPNIVIITISMNFSYFILFFILLLVSSIILINKLSHHFKKKDPKEIVIDEFLGQSIPILFFLYIMNIDFTSDLFFFEEMIKDKALKFRETIIYGGFNHNKLIWILLSFISFRIFDIAKPFPINIIDKKIKSGLGVVLDDIVAGIYASAIVTFLFLF